MSSLQKISSVSCWLVFQFIMCWILCFIELTVSDGTLDMPDLTDSDYSTNIHYSSVSNSWHNFIDWDFNDNIPITENIYYTGGQHGNYGDINMEWNNGMMKMIRKQTDKYGMFNINLTNYDLNVDLPLKFEFDLLSKRDNQYFELLFHVYANEGSLGFVHSYYVYNWNGQCREINYNSLALRYRTDGILRCNNNAEIRPFLNNQWQHIVLWTIPSRNIFCIQRTYNSNNQHVCAKYTTFNGTIKRLFIYRSIWWTNAWNYFDNFKISQHIQTTSNPTSNPTSTTSNPTATTSNTTSNPTSTTSNPTSNPTATTSNPTATTSNPTAT
eukprot:103921_1